MNAQSIRGNGVKYNVVALGGRGPKFNANFDPIIFSVLSGIPKVVRKNQEKTKI